MFVVWANQNHTTTMRKLPGFVSNWKRLIASGTDGQKAIDKWDWELEFMIPKLCEWGKELRFVNEEYSNGLWYL